MLSFIAVDEQWKLLQCSFVVLLQEDGEFQDIFGVFFTTIAKQ